MTTTQIVDNPAATFTGDWIGPYAGQGYGDSVHYAAAGDGSATARWSATVAGRFKVYVTWSPQENRATNAPFTVRDGETILATVRVNQQLAPDGGWLLLGEFAGTLSVTLTNDADGFVIADAVRFEPVATPNPEPEPQPEPPPVPPTVSLGCPCSLGVSKMKAVSTLKYEGDKLVSHTLEVSCEGAGPGPGPVDPPPPPVDPGTGVFELNADLTGIQLLPADSPWNQRIDHLPAHPRSAEIIGAVVPVVVGLPRTQNDFGPDFGIPYSAGTGYGPVPVGYNAPAAATESDPGPHPIPLLAPVEGGSDKHLIYYDRDNKKFHELLGARVEKGGFVCDFNAMWDITKPWDQRPLGWTSADAAGLPILPLMIRFDEFQKAMNESDPDKQHLGHALRFTLARTGRGFLTPARHFASVADYALPGRPPMGMRCRIKSSLDLSIFNPPTQILMRTLQRYGGILADNGTNWFFTGTSDARWGNYWDDITGVTGSPPKLGFKSFAGQLFLDNWEVVGFADSEVVTQV